MSDNYGIDDKTRFMVLYLDAEMKLSRIAKILNRSERTIREWEAKLQKGVDVRERKKFVRAKKIMTQEVEKKILEHVNENPEKATTRKLAARIGVSKSTIHKFLVDKGLKYKGFDKSVMYGEKERLLRMEFCKRMLADNGKLIYQTFYSDEMGIVLGKTHKSKAWQFPTNTVRQKQTENVKLNCWGAISINGATSLEIFSKSMNGDRYREIIEKHKEEMDKLYADGYFFVQDNHPTHRVNLDWMKAQNFELIKLPSRSPDLNIIENLWAALKDNVASDAPTNERELRESLIKNWDKLTKAYTEGICNVLLTKAKSLNINKTIILT